MSQSPTSVFRFAGRAPLPLAASFDGGRLTSDAGVVVLADIERRFGIAERLARCIEDPSSPERVGHTLADMIRFLVLLIAAGYPDADDCDALREADRSRPRRSANGTSDAATRSQLW